MNGGSPRGFGFDFDHTLGLDHGLERLALSRLAASLGHPLADDPGTDAWIGRLLAEFRAGILPMQAMIARFADHFALGDLDPELWREACYALVDRVEAIAGASDLLATLKRLEIPVAILTNGWSPLQQKKIARALGEGAVDIVLVSDRLGVGKPQRAAFDALAAALNLPNEAVWYVGDSPTSDAGGALAAGMSAVWLDAEGIAYPADLPPPTLRIGTLRELEMMVENAVDP